MVAILVAFTFVGLVLMDFGVQKWNAWQTARSAEWAAHRAPAVESTLWMCPKAFVLPTYTRGSDLALRVA